MTIAAVSQVTHLAHERSTASVDDATRAESFAGVLAGLMAPSQRPDPKTAAQAAGTSELDQPEGSDDADPGSVGENKDSKTAASSAASAASTNDVVRSLAALDPQLQAKLARVAARMREETGHSVTVEETYRSQTRQNALYAQGRDTAGPVVTWTKNSKHTQGRAVDVELDGGSAGLDVYKMLQRIANEEGLRTLGAKDPGHLELRGNGKNVNDGTTPTTSVEPADASGPDGVSIARIAEVAKVADVRPPQVARVAQVPQPSVAAAAVAARGSNSKNDSSTDRGTQGDSRGYAALGGAHLSPHEANAPRFSLDTVAPMTGADAVARAERIMNAIDSAPARPLSQITMSVDAGNGTTDRIHLAMRGSSLDTTIDTGDTRLSQVLSARSDELSRALAKDGIELQELRVRTATTTNTVTAAAATQNAQTFADASTQSRFNRGDAWQQQRNHQHQQNQQDRQRSQERGRQQRQGRGGCQ